MRKYNLIDNDNHPITSDDFNVVNKHLKKILNGDWRYDKKNPSTDTAIGIFQLEDSTYLIFHYQKNKTNMLVTNNNDFLEKAFSNKIALKLEECIL